MNKQNNKKNFKEIILTISITIIALLFLFSSLKLFFEKPDYENYCKYPYKIPSKNCSETPEPTYCEGIPVPQYDSKNCIINYTCSNCNKIYQNKLEIYNKKEFLGSIILGIVTIIIASLISIEIIQNGLFFSAVLLIGINTIKFWHYLNKFLQFIMLGIALSTLIIFTIKNVTNSKNQHKHKNNKKRK